MIDFWLQKHSKKGQVYGWKMISVSKLTKKVEKIIVEKFWPWPDRRVEEKVALFPLLKKLSTYTLKFQFSSIKLQNSKMKPPVYQFYYCLSPQFYRFPYCLPSRSERVNEVCALYNKKIIHILPVKIHKVHVAASKTDIKI